MVVAKKKKPEPKLAQGCVLKGYKGNWSLDNSAQASAPQPTMQEPLKFLNPEPLNSNVDR